jgi:hypothetical protein
VVVDANDVVEFKGSDAVVHRRHSVFIGGELEASDGRVRTKYLCKDSVDVGFEVVVEGSSGICPTTTHVKRLNEAEFQYLLSRFPYRKG